MELSTNYLRALGFRRKRKPNNETIYQLDTPYSLDDWVTLSISKVQDTWVIRTVKATGEFSRNLIAESIVRYSVDEVIALAEFLRYGKWPEAKAA